MSVVPSLVRVPHLRYCGIVDVTVRIARDDDEAALSAIDHATWAPDNSPAPRPAEGRVFLDGMAPWDEVLVAEDEHCTVVGWVIVGKEHPIDSNAHVRALKGLAVDPTVRGRGVGGKLVDAVIARARDEGVTRLRSRVLATNTPSLRIHERRGFHIEGVLRDEFVIDEQPVDDVLLALRLMDATPPLRARSVDAGLRFEPMSDARLDDFVTLLTSCRWEHFGRIEHTPSTARAMWEDGSHSGDEAATYLVETGAGDVIGLVRLFDLEDPIPLFDIRLREDSRGQGYGRAALEWLTRELLEQRGFTSVQAYTRADNFAMRATLRRCGYVKEAHHRADRPGHADSTAYRILKTDWESGSATPVAWFDEF